MALARANPFRSDRIEALPYRFLDGDWEQIRGVITQPRWRGVLVGPHGSGKTTLIERVDAQLRYDGWNVRSIRCSDGVVPSWAACRALLRGADLRTVLIVDGLEQWPTWRWWDLRWRSRSAGGVLATSHRPGRLPLLHRHRTSVALLLTLVKELTQEDSSAWLQERCLSLYELHGGDIRACLRQFYDEWGAGDEEPRKPKILL